MNKKAAIKKALHDVLSKRFGTACTIERPLANMASVSFGTWAYEITFLEYDDNGDLSTEEEYDDIYAALQQIVDEHNNSGLV